MDIGGFDLSSFSITMNPFLFNTYILQTLLPRVHVFAHLVLAMHVYRLLIQHRK